MVLRASQALRQVNRLAARSAILKGEGAVDTLLRAMELQRQGHDIIHLEIGDPNFDAPLPIREKLVNSLHRGETHYNPPPGIPLLRETISNYFNASRTIKTTPERIVAFPGAKPAIFSALLATVEEGDEVITPNPGYPCYETTIQWVGGKPIFLPLEEKSGFRFNLNSLQSLITPKTKAIILNSPHNPTGGVLSIDDLYGVAEIVKKHNLYVISDEIYTRILHDGGEYAPSIATIPGLLDHTILIDGCSKSFAMTGYRLGFAHFPEELVQPVINIAINSWTCLPEFIQKGAIEALSGSQDFIQKIRSEFKERRDVVVQRLNRIPGFSCVTPPGAFYAFPNIKGTGFTSKQCSEFILNEAKVALLPGTDYGSGGEGYLRVSFANSLTNIETALDRIHNAFIVRENLRTMGPIKNVS